MTSVRDFPVYICVPAHELIQWKIGSGIILKWTAIVTGGSKLSEMSGRSY